MAAQKDTCPRKLRAMDEQAHGDEDKDRFLKGHAGGLCVCVDGGRG
jgi:hypothetical protein